MIVFVLCVAGAIYQLQEDRYNDARTAALLICEQNNVGRSDFADAITAQKTVNEEVAKFLQSSVSFRRAEGRDALADQAIASKSRVVGASKLLRTPKRINCEETYERGVTVYVDGSVEVNISEPKQNP